MSYQSSIRKCREMLALAHSGTTVWWRREGFHQEPFRGAEPKWHVLTGRFTHHNDPDMKPEDRPVWAALCGYRKDFDERMFERFPSLRKSAPKKDTRCRKCAAELPAHLAARAASPAEASPDTNPAEKDIP
jgi:hypothetical protein